MKPIHSHKELAAAITGKKILHLNSLGKDAVLCLEWLNKFAKCEVVSVFFKFDAGYPTDEKYWDYLKKRFPRTTFITVPAVQEINEKMAGMLQSPLFMNYVAANQDYDKFDFKRCVEELRVKYNCDYACSGISCYEGMGRALYIRRVGLLDLKNKFIYPIGLMKQQQVIDLIKATGIKLNPSYKFAPESLDSASYFKMRYAMIGNEEYKKTIIKHYPMMALDEYRYEVLFGKSKKG